MPEHDHIVLLPISCSILPSVLSEPGTLPGVYFVIIQRCWLSQLAAEHAQGPPAANRSGSYRSCS